MADPLSLLLHLQRLARDAATVTELTFVIVNETHAMAAFRQAVLWEKSRGVTALSGVPMPEDNAPFTLFLGRLCRWLDHEMADGGVIDPHRLPEADRAEWSEWLPAAALWIPLPMRGDGASLLLARDQAWTQGETALLSELAHAYGHALAALRRPSFWAEWRIKAGQRRRWLVGLGLATVAAGAFPVPLTVLAPAEVVAAHPAVIRSPLEGVVSHIYVRPGERVAEGQLLFDLDDTTLRGKAEVAEKTLAAAEAELRQVAQFAVTNPEATSKLAAATGAREQQAAELAYLKSLLERIKVKAPSGGIAVLDDPSEWIGRPVVVGEKVLALAEETDTEIEAWLSPADAIELGAGAPVTLFLNVAPLSPISGAVSHVAYEATARPDGTVAHRVRARITSDKDKPRLGLKGTARLSGQTVALAYWLLRRPIGAVRAVLGL